MSTPAPRRPFKLLDAMALIAATAAGLGAARGMRGWLWDSTDVSFVAGTFAAIVLEAVRWIGLGLPLLVAWTVALALLPLLSPRSRPRLNDALGRPGMTACGSATFVLAIGAINLTALFLALLVNDLARVMNSDEIRETFVFFITYNLLIAPGSAVTVAWSMQALSGRWRPEPDWLDRAGRFVGLVWMVLTVLHPWLLSVIGGAWVF